MDVDAVSVLASRGLVHSSTARAAGLDGRELRQARADERLVRVRRDAYVKAERWAASTGAERYLLQVRAAAATLRSPTFSHHSAAAVWGLPMIGRWPAVVHVVGPPRAGGRSWRGVVRHQTDLPVRADERDGLLVTDAATTVCDMARVAPFATVLAMADHALRTGLTTSDELLDVVGQLGARRGSRAARRVAEAADPRAESAGESLSRARMIELAVPLPELQHEVSDAGGLIGRTDFYWQHRRLVGEFDGRLKYRVAGIDDDARVEDRLWREKSREDRLRATGLGVTRWTWDTALDPHRFAAHLRAAGLL
ncbi:hypothetical protein [Cellulomonas edaphi]|uniref:Type IV toxin-antitoxin system AbiEi family antitoxin domain-containing protein n=1 Tax=Cellulomonas edaphi TaxID=3053468 RepID=A0ABT7S968_9CELL|nr:hypothetical protein [Cellulomons edaphi]MDM7832168.1 hypothetical protein [Cellulomons edaphi]